MIAKYLYKADVALRYLLITSICTGSIFVVSGNFIDSHILPKQLITVAGILLLAIYAVLLFVFYSQKRTISDDNIQSHVAAIFIIVTLGQAIYGLLQYLGIIVPTMGFRVTGCFDNPAGYASSLCVVFPFYIYAFSKATRFWRWAIGCMAVMIIIAVTLSESRAGMLSLVVVILFWIMPHLKLSKTTKCLLLSVFLTGMSAGLYFLKKDSADGRLLTWKCSWEMFKDKWLSGHGVGGFEAHYMNYQATYLANHPDSVYSQLADNVQYPFNEYIYIMVNYGVFGLFLLFICVSFLIYRYLKRPTLANKTAVSCWLAVGVFACFSYPLIYPFVWVALLYSVYLLTGNPFKSLCLRLVRFRTIAGGMILCLLIYAGLLIFQRIDAELRWKNAYNLSLSGETDEALIQYREIYVQLKNDRYFLYNYGVMLFEAEKYEESLDMVLQCRTHWADYDVELLLGELYEQLGQSINAMQHYRWASFMCPNRFVPLYRLVLLLQKEERLPEAKQLAQEIVDKPVKVDSPTVIRIKREMRELIN